MGPLTGSLEAISCYTCAISVNTWIEKKRTSDGANRGHVIILVPPRRIIQEPLVWIDLKIFYMVHLILNGIDFPVSVKISRRVNFDEETDDVIQNNISMGQVDYYDGHGGQTCSDLAMRETPSDLESP